MEYKGDIYISVSYKKEDYNKLNLTVTSPAQDWQKAIEIFEDRVNGRYLQVIGQSKNSEEMNKDGFVIMAINCLLIETLMQFKEGIDATPRGENCKYYTNFLKNGFPHIFTDVTRAKKFYKDIRCGILHSAQTKNKSKLVADLEQTSENIVELYRGEYITVNVPHFTAALITYYDNYVQKLKNEKNKDLRQNFINKMNYICQK